jgi:cytochrome c-type biogenesis protein CcmH/NrfG
MPVIRLFARRPEMARTAALRFSRRLRAERENADAWHGLGSALAALGDRAGAFAAFRNAVRLDATRVHSQRALGNLLFDSGQFDHAVRCFEYPATE